MVQSNESNLLQPLMTTNDVARRLQISIEGVAILVRRGELKVRYLPFTNGRRLCRYTRTVKRGGELRQERVVKRGRPRFDPADVAAYQRRALAASESEEISAELPRPPKRATPNTRPTYKQLKRFEPAAPRQRGASRSIE